MAVRYTPLSCEIKTEIRIDDVISVITDVLLLPRSRAKQLCNLNHGSTPASVQTGCLVG